VSSIVADAWSANGLLEQAVVLFPRPAHVTASAAGPGRIDRDGVATLDPFHSGSQLFHPPGDLLPEREGRRIVLPVASVARHDREVGMAKAGAGDFDDHLARSRVRLRHLLKLWSTLARGTSHSCKSASHFNPVKLGTKEYSPPRSTLNDSMPWTRRRTGSFGIVNLAPPSCSPTSGSRSLSRDIKLPLVQTARQDRVG